MSFEGTVLAIVVALLVHDMLKDAIAGIAKLSGALVEAILRWVWKG